MKERSRTVRGTAGPEMPCAPPTHSQLMMSTRTSSATAMVAMLK